QLHAPKAEVLLPFLQEQNFKSLMSRTSEKFGFDAAELAETVGAAVAEVAPKEVNYSLVTDESVLKTWITRAQEAGHVAVDTETTGLDAMQVDLVGISLSIKPGEACYIPLGHLAEGEEAATGDASSAAPQGDLFAAPKAAPTGPKLAAGQLPKAKVLELLKPLLENDAVLKIGQNIKYDMQIFRRNGIQVSPVEDTMLLSYVLDAGKNAHGMDMLADLHLGHKTIHFSEVMGSGRNKKQSFAEVELQAARDYAAEDADITLRLWKLLKTRLLEARMVTVYETIERPLIDVLVDMEHAGIKDAAHLKALSDDFAARMATLETAIYALAGREFTIGSPKQLGEVLFEELGLEGGKKSSKTGAYSTGAEILEELAA
ncbi:MAG: DNA polymerase, partial [Rickettsiales bacterium]